MADRSINELVEAKSVTPTDLFVLQQGATAKRLTGQTLENWLLSFADGHGGIQSITKIGTSGLVDTYRITLADTTITDFTVTNGRGIKSIAKTNTQNLNDTYTITYTDGTSSTFTVTNGAKGDKGDNTYTWIKYASKDPTDPPHSMGDIPDRWLGIYTGAKSSAPTLWSEYKWYEIKGVKGDIGDPATIVSTSTVYQTSTSGTVIPSGSWLKNPPAVPQGRYLWTRTTTQFNSGNPVVSYGVSYVGKDGKGQVESVNGKTGIVDLKAPDIGAIPNSFAPEEVLPENTLEIIQDAGRLLAKGGDAIVAQGISNGWSYSKYESGLAFCFKRLEVDTQVKTADGSMFCSPLIPAEKLPFTFIAPPLESITLTGAEYGGFVYPYPPGSELSPMEYTSSAYIYKPTALQYGTSKYWLNFLEIGRWK